MNPENSPKENILAVDDDPNNRMLLSKMLRDTVNVDTAENGRECLEKAGQGYKLILLDIMMPDLSGIEICKSLKSDPNTSDIPVIYLSALDDSQIKAEGLEAGGVDFVSKPFDQNELKSRIKTHLTLRRRTQKLKEYSQELEEKVAARTRALDRHLQCERIANSILKMTLNQNVDLHKAMEDSLQNFLSLPWLECRNEGIIYLVDEKRESLERVVEFNISPEMKERCFRVEKGQCLCGKVWESGERMFIPDINQVDTQVVFPPAPGGYLALPLKFADQVIGVLAVYTCPEVHFEEKDLNSLEAAADALSTLIIRTRQQEELQKTEAKYQTIFETTGSATALIDEQSGIVTTANKQFTFLCGLDKEEIEGRMHYLDFVHPEDKKTLEYYFQMRGEIQGIPEEYEFSFINKSGEKRYIIAKVSRIPDMQSRVVSFLDLTEKREVEDQLRRRNFYHPITGLPNRSLFKNRLRKVLKSRGAEQKENNYSVFLLNLDRFKLINESLGRQSGDELLKRVGERLEKAVPAEETVGHFQADEFALMVHIDDVPDAALFAERLKAEFHAPFNIEDQEIFLTASIGFTLLEEYSSAEAVIRDAEIALSRAKSQGTNTYVMADQFMNQEIREILDMENHLRRARENDELRLYYQPMLDIATERCIGFEGLIRWQREGGLVPPNKFIPLAEETELINPIGNWIFQQACKDLKQLQQMSAEQLAMHINLSGVQLKNQDLLPSLGEIMKKTNTPPEQIILELTESVIMGDVQHSATLLQKLKGMRFNLAVDDFGTGYSSLSYLQKFPMSTIKIDRSFINNIHDQAGFALVKTIVDLAGNLGMETVAEGIETREQLHILRGLGCKRAQGFYFAKPMPVEEVREYMQNEGQTE